MKLNTLDTTGETSRAQVVNGESFSTEDLVDYVSRTNAGEGVSKPEMASIEAAFEDAFAYFLSQGSFHRPLLAKREGRTRLLRRQYRLASSVAASSKVRFRLYPSLASTYYPGGHHR